MNTMEPLVGADPAPQHESAEVKQRRVAHEAVELAQARASAAAGRVVDSASVKAWIDSLGTDHERPVPYSGR